MFKDNVIMHNNVLGQLGHDDNSPKSVAESEDSQKSSPSGKKKLIVNCQQILNYCKL